MGSEMCIRDRCSCSVGFYSEKPFFDHPSAVPFLTPWFISPQQSTRTLVLATQFHSDPFRVLRGTLSPLPVSIAAVLRDMLGRCCLVLRGRGPALQQGRADEGETVEPGRCGWLQGRHFLGFAFAALAPLPPVLADALPAALFTPSPLAAVLADACLLYTSPSPRDGLLSRMPSSA